MAEDIDIAGSPTLNAIREVAGEDAVRRLVAERGGRRVYLPEKLTPERVFVKIVGMEAAHAICEHFGRHLILGVPTGRGFAHGRRIDPAEVWAMRDRGASIGEIAHAVRCAERTIMKVLSGRRPVPAEPKDSR